jgi:hypothetical protein
VKLKRRENAQGTPLTFLSFSICFVQFRNVVYGPRLPATEVVRCLCAFFVRPSPPFTSARSALASEESAAFLRETCVKETLRSPPFLPYLTLYVWEKPDKYKGSRATLMSSGGWRHRLNDDCLRYAFFHNCVNYIQCFYLWLWVLQSWNTFLRQIRQW